MRVRQTPWRSMITPLFTSRFQASPRPTLREASRPNSSSMADSYGSPTNVHRSARQPQARAPAVRRRRSAGGLAAPEQSSGGLDRFRPTLGVRQHRARRLERDAEQRARHVDGVAHDFDKHRIGERSGDRVQVQHMPRRLLDHPQAGARSKVVDHGQEHIQRPQPWATLERGPEAGWQRQLRLGFERLAGVADLLLTDRRLRQRVDRLEHVGEEMRLGQRKRL